MTIKPKPEIPNRKTIELVKLVVFEEVDRALAGMEFVLNKRNIVEHFDVWDYAPGGQKILTHGGAPALRATYYERNPYPKENMYPTISLACWDKEVIEARDEIYEKLKLKYKIDLVENNTRQVFGHGSP